MFEKIASITVAIKDLASSGLKSISKNAGDLKDKAESLGKSWKSHVEDKFESSFAVLSKVSGYVLGIGTAITAFGGITVKAASDNEQFTVALTNMLKSAEDANALIGKLKSFAVVTPFELNTLKDMTKTLVAYGFGAGDVIPVLQNLGDIAAGVGTEKLPTIVEAFGKIRTKGKADMEQLNRMLEAGVPILEELAKNTGKTTTEIFKMVETGKIGFSDVAEAMKTLSTGSGIFAGGMEKQSKTLAGIFSNIKDIIGQTFIGVGNVFLEDLKGIGNSIQKAFTGDNLNSVITWFVIVRKTFVDIKNDILDTVDSFRIMGLEIENSWIKTVTNMRVGFYDKFFNLMPGFVRKQFGETIKVINEETEKSVNQYNKNSSEIDEISKNSINRRNRAEQNFSKQIEELAKNTLSNLESRELKKTALVQTESTKRAEIYKINWERLKETYDFDIQAMADATTKKTSSLDSFTLKNSESVQKLITGIQGISQIEADAETARIIRRILSENEHGKQIQYVEELKGITKELYDALGTMSRIDFKDPINSMGTMIKSAEQLTNVLQTAYDVMTGKGSLESQVSAIERSRARSERAVATELSRGEITQEEADKKLRSILENFAESMEDVKLAWEDKSKVKLTDVFDPVGATARIVDANNANAKANYWISEANTKIGELNAKIAESAKPNIETAFIESKTRTDKLKTDTERELSEYNAVKSGSDKALASKEYLEWKQSNDALLKSQNETNELLKQLVAAGKTPIAIDGKTVSQTTSKYNPATQKLIDKGVA